MKWWIDSIAESLEGLRTDQGGEYRLSCMIYREYMEWGAKTPATPDGRYDGERFAQGFAPSDLRCRAGIGDLFNAIGSLDHTKLCASNANLTFGGEDFSPATLAAVFRVFAEKGAHLLQPNCNAVETLLDAQRHPERHLDLMVKVCGFSTRFVTLSPRFQQEIIDRHRLK
jgi:formate C-acetyltransferase